MNRDCGESLVLAIVQFTPPVRSSHQLNTSSAKHVALKHLITTPHIILHIFPASIQVTGHNNV